MAAKKKPATVFVFPRERLAEMLDLLGWTQFDLARRADVQPSKISKLLNNAKSDPRLQTFEKLCRAIGSERWGVPAVTLYLHKLTDRIEPRR